MGVKAPSKEGSSPRPVIRMRTFLSPSLPMRRAWTVRVHGRALGRPFIDLTDRRDPGGPVLEVA